MAQCFGCRIQGLPGGLTFRDSLFSLSDIFCEKGFGRILFRTSRSKSQKWGSTRVLCVLLCKLEA